MPAAEARSRFTLARMIRLRRSAPLDAGLRTLLESAGENIQDVSRLLHDLLIDYPEHAEMIGEVQDREHVGDRIARDIIHRLSGNGSHHLLPFGDKRGRGALDIADGHALATALDDIVDFAEHGRRARDLQRRGAHGAVGRARKGPRGRVRPSRARPRGARHMRRRSARAGAGRDPPPRERRRPRAPRRRRVPLRQRHRSDGRDPLEGPSSSRSSRRSTPARPSRTSSRASPSSAASSSAACAEQAPADGAASVDCGARRCAPRPLRASGRAILLAWRKPRRAATSWRPPQPRWFSG